MHNACPSLLIRSAKVVRRISDKWTTQTESLLIADGKIVQCLASGEKKLPTAERTIAAQGAWLLPGFIDLGVRINALTPSALMSVAQTARQQGISALALMPSAGCPLDNPEAIKQIGAFNKTNPHLPKIVPIACATRNAAGLAMSEIGLLLSAGAGGIALDPFPEDVVFLRSLLIYLQSFADERPLQVFVHPLFAPLARLGYAHDGEIAGRLGLPGIPHCAETTPIQLITALMPDSIDRRKIQFHYAPIASRHCLMPIAAQNASSGVSWRHLLDDEQSLSTPTQRFNNTAKRLPPLRAKEDRQALLNAVLNEQNVCIHSQILDEPTLEIAQPFGEAPYRGDNLHDYLHHALSLHQSLATGAKPHPAMLSAMCHFPAQLLNQSTHCRLMAGDDANLCLMDLQKNHFRLIGTIHNGYWHDPPTN